MLFIVALIGLAGNALVGLFSVSYARRYEEASARWHWLRAANLMRAETGFVGGMLKRSHTALTWNMRYFFIDGNSSPPCPGGKGR